MIRAHFYIAVLICFFLPEKIYPQNITGTWEGQMGGEFLRVQVVQKKLALCGQTYDYEIAFKQDHCKAYFTGWYDAEKALWTMIGTTFIENSGNHVLMKIRLRLNKIGNRSSLIGTVGLQTSSFFGLGSDDEAVELRRVPSPPRTSDDAPVCFPVPKKNLPPPVIKTPVLQKPLPVPKKISVKPVLPEPVKTDTVKKIIPVPMPVSPVILSRPDPVPVDKKVSSRKNIEVSRLQVNSKNITLKVYDNGIVDNDTVSIFYNGKLLAAKKRLSEVPLVLNIELDESAALHEITMFAENLGTIPPNTALIVVTAGDKRYELHSSASLQENAVLVFEYKPK